MLALGDGGETTNQGTAMTALLQHGPYWIALVVFVFVVKMVLEKQYSSFRRDHTAIVKFADDAVATLRDLVRQCGECQRGVILTIKSAVGARDDKILDAVRTMNDDTNKATGGIILALGIKENRTVEAIERLLIALREDLVAARAQPPVGGTGSQVKDGKAA